MTKLSSLILRILLTLALTTLSVNAGQDQDGIADEDDICPGTTIGVIVDESGYATGCSEEQKSIDSDGDSIPNLEDICPGTSIGAIVDESGDATGCSEAQKDIDNDDDGISDALDDDDDNDGLSDIQEQEGWIVELPFGDDFIEFQVNSNPNSSDTDGDGVNDQTEKTNATNPNNIDTDGDGVNDDIDEELTDQLEAPYVGEDGIFAQTIFNNADDDNDGVINSEDQCWGTKSTFEVYTSGENKGCSTKQKVQLSSDSDLDGVKDSDDECPGTNSSTYTNNVGCQDKTKAVTRSMGSSSTYYGGNVNNLNIGGSAGNAANNVNNLDKLTDFESDRFIGQTRGGEVGIYNTIMQIARDLKNLFYAIATVFFLIICLKLIFASNTEEELGKFKKGILWITIGLIVMQLAFAFTQILFDQGVSARLGASLIENLVTPMIDLVRTLAAIFFIAMAIFAFYRLVTANGNEEAIKSGKMTIVYALMGFILVRIAQTIVEAFYGKINCESFNIGFVTFESETCTNTLDISTGANIIIDIIKWLNGFVAIVVLIMIIYAGVQIILSGGDEEKIKKGKQAITYVAIGLFVLLTNFLILTIFLRPEAVI